MISKSYYVDRDDNGLPLSSFFDEFGLKPEEIDLFKLRIRIDQDWSGVYYVGELPQIVIIIEYDE